MRKCLSWLPAVNPLYLPAVRWIECLTVIVNTTFSSIQSTRNRVVQLNASWDNYIRFRNQSNAVVFSNGFRNCSAKTSTNQRNLKFLSTFISIIFYMLNFFLQINSFCLIFFHYNHNHNNNNHHFSSLNLSFLMLFFWFFLKLYI